MEESDAPQVSVDSIEIRGTVKWFNAVKGYGFLTPEDGSPDVFLHLTVLRMAGHERLMPGTTVSCEAVKGAKGMQVLRVLEVDDSTAIAEPEFVSGPAQDQFSDAEAGLPVGPLRLIAACYAPEVPVTSWPVSSLMGRTASGTRAGIRVPFARARDSTASRERR